MKLHVLGIDLGKTVFHLVGLAQGKHLLTQLAETPRARGREFRLTALGGGNRRRVGSSDPDYKIGKFS
jgi:hypothetical protein